MYPLWTWKREGVEQRLQRMLDAELEYEALVASAQVIEQVFKRVIRSELSRRGLQVSKESEPGKGHTLVVAKDRNTLDASLSDHCQSFQAIRSMWPKAMEMTPCPKLPALVDAVCGKSAWTALTFPRAFTPGRPLVIRAGDGDRGDGSPRLRCGLFPARHRIVHGVNGLSEFTVKALAPFGMRSALALLHPTSGLVAHGLRDPLIRCCPMGRPV